MLNSQCKFHVKTSDRSSPYPRDEFLFFINNLPPLTLSFFPLSSLSLSLFFHLIDERANFHRGYLASSSSGSFRFLSIRIEYIWREGENEYRDEYTFILGNSWCSVEYWCLFSFLIPAEPIPIFLRTISFLYLPPSLSFFLYLLIIPSTVDLSSCRHRFIHSSLP